MINLFEQPYKICFSKNPIKYSFYTDEDTTAQGFIIGVRIMYRILNSGNDFAELITIPLTPDTDNKASIDLMTLIDSLLEFYLPDIDSADFSYCEKQSVEFYIDYRTATEAEPATAWEDGSANVKVAIKGGLSYEKWKGPNYFVTYLDNHKDFLCWKRNKQYVSAKQDNFLYYLHREGTDTISMKVKINYTDGSTDEISEAAKYLMPVKYGIYAIPTGVDQLDLTSQNAQKTIYYYEIEVYNNGGVLAGPYTYWVDYRIFSTADFGQLSYRNSLGGLESILLLGSIEREMNYNFQTMEKMNSEGYHDLEKLQPQYRQFESKEERTYKAAVGFITPMEQDRLRDAAMKRELYHPKNGQWKPILLTSDKIPMAKSGDMLYVASLEFRYAFDNINYTPDEIEVGELPACAVPQNLAVSDISGKRITLEWTAGASALGFVIQASGKYKTTSVPTPWDPEEHEIIIHRPWDIVGSSTTPFFKYDADNWLTIKFRVRANCAMSQSEFSNEITVNP